MKPIAEWSQTGPTKSRAASDSQSLNVVQEMIRTCIQCGTCSGSCPNEFAMDHTPRKMWRMVLLDQTETVFQSRTFDLCSTCYYCSLRCPRGLPLTKAMAALKQIAAVGNVSKSRKTTRFNKSFLDSARRHGRIREMEFMTFYFASMKNPLLPLKYAPLGFKLMRKRKVPIQIPFPGKGRLDRIFEKVEELEGTSK